MLKLNQSWIHFRLDDRYWLPLLLDDKCFRARFLFRGQSSIIGMRIDEIDSAELVGVEAVVPIPSGAPLQESIPSQFGAAEDQAAAK